MESKSTLERELSDALPDTVSIRAYHVFTPKTVSTAIFSAEPGQVSESTFCESHFLGIVSSEYGNEVGVFVFAIEVLIFSTNTRTIVFVSKADSSGFISRLHLPLGSRSVPQSITRTFLNYLIKPRLGDQPLVLSLFARSQHSYLFPGSSENAEKHILDDRQLIKWWCRVLDTIWRPYETSSYTITAHVVVPGCDQGETRAFFPPSHIKDLSSCRKWITSYPLKEMSLDENLPPRCLIPRLPDDPKSRFLDDLDCEFVGPQGEWRSVKTMDQFWEMMSYRQECSAGRLVGFIWVIFDHHDQEQGHRGQQVSTSFSSNTCTIAPLPTPGNSQLFSSDFLKSEVQNEDLQPIKVVSPPPSFPILEPTSESRRVQHDIGNKVVQSIGEVNGDTRPDELNAETENAGSNITPSQILIPSTDYELLMESLLQLDFAGAEQAAQSTRKWLDEVSTKAGLSDIGINVVGRRPLDTSQIAHSKTTPQVNMLTGIKKKRKVDQAEGVGELILGDTASPTFLSANLIRKKAKTNTVG